MDKKYFLLEARENSGFIKIFQTIFGILCICVALFWVIFQYQTLNADGTLWITIIFLVGFGAYQIAAGLGKIIKFIEIDSQKIVLKQNSFLPKIDLKPSDLEKIEIYPLSISFSLGKKKKFILRFGLRYTDIIQPVKDAVTDFANINGILLEYMKEEI